MNFTTFAELKTSILDELNRDDITDAVEGFIALCEARTERRLRTREMAVKSTLTVDAAEVDVPADFLETRSLWLTTTPVTYLNYFSLEDFIDHQASRAATGKPTVYTIVGDKYLFSPSPDDSYTANIVYYQSIPRLSDVQASNWLLAKHPDIYFYGSLIHSAPYLKDDPRLAVWLSLYDQAIDTLLLSDDRAKTQSHGLKARARTFG